MPETVHPARRKSETIIHGAALAAGAAAAASVIPGSDAMAIMPIQVAMVTAVSREYGVPVSAGVIKSTVYASLGSIVGKAGAGILLRWTPIAGNAVRASVAFGVTQALGRLLLERLESGGSLEDGLDLTL